MAQAGAELRGEIGDELRAEAEADERAAAILRLRRRSRTDVCFELMHRGDRVRAHLPVAAVTGFIVHTASSLATLAVGASDRLHVNLDSRVVLSTEADGARQGRSRNPMEPTSFPALLRSFELGATRLRLELFHAPHGVAGVIGAVTPDHVLVVDEDTKWYIPHRAVVAVWV